MHPRSGDRKGGHSKGDGRPEAPDQRSRGQETVVGGTSDQKGRIFHLRDTTHPPEAGDDGTRRRPWRRRRLNDLTDGATDWSTAHLLARLELIRAQVEAVVAARRQR